jgi:ECF transporter S component (folate family)
MSKNSSKSKTKMLCVAAVFAAMYVGLDYLSTAISSFSGGTMKLSLSGLPVIIAAILLGPVWGAAVGFVGAFVGQMISYGFTATTLLWVLPAVVRGLSVGLLYIAFKRSEKIYILTVEVVISAMLVTAFNTLAMYIDTVVYKYSMAIFGMALVNRVIAAVVTSVVFAVILPPILKALRKVIK